MRNLIFYLLIAGVAPQGGTTTPTSPSGPYTSQVPNIDVCGSAQGGVKCPGAGSNGYFYRCCSSAGHCGPKNDVCPAPSSPSDCETQQLTSISLLHRSKTKASTAVPAAKAISETVPSPRSPRHTPLLLLRLSVPAIPAAPSSTPDAVPDSAAPAATSVAAHRTSAAPPTGASLSGVFALVRRCCKRLG